MTSQGDVRYRVGTIQYTRAGLATLFVWMLWGDFCFTLMEAVIPSILPLRLKALGAPNLTLSLIVSTIPSILNMLLNPIISFRSDRFRSRWGRRIPFLLMATPFLSLALVLMGFSSELGVFIHHMYFAHATQWSSTWVTILVIGVLMVFFQFFNMFAKTVCWYFFNDVVPLAFMARFLGMCRMAGGAAGSLYNYFIFKHALTHMREIFVGAALLYFVAFMLMCWRVKEGEYPPPVSNVGGGHGFWASARTYVVECMGHRIYLYYFLSSVCMTCANACAVFNVFLPLSMGITLEQLGKLGAIVGSVAVLLSYPAGALGDRFHPLRVFFWINLILLVIAPFNLIWLVRTFDPRTTFHIMIVFSVIHLPFSAIYTAVAFPMQMQLFPKDRFGQFCSANALMQSIFNIAATLAAGVFMDFLQKHFSQTSLGKDYSYRFIPCWSLFFTMMNMLLLTLVYREWKRLGGRDYQPPLPGDHGRQSCDSTTL